jgi:ketosteroid isomerase-like protein
MATPTQHQHNLTAAIEQLRKAMIEKNAAALTSLSSPHLTYGHSNGTIETQAQFVDTIVSGRSNFINIQLTNAYIHIMGNTAVARHTFTAETHDAGKPPASFTLHIIWVWQLEGTQWKMLARQAVRV